MSETARRLAVAEDLLDGDETPREILGGEIVEKATPSGEHADAQAALTTTLRAPFHRRGDGGRGGWWILTECEIALDPHEVIRPDLAGWRRERVPERPSGFPVAERPDWVCEILSPSTARRDLGVKMRLLHRHEVPHYWTVDVVQEVLTVHRWSAEGYLVVLTATRGETVEAEPFGAVPLRVGLLFGEDPED